MAYDLEFEKPLAELEKKIHALQRKVDRLKPEERIQLQTLELELRSRTEEIYEDLTAWQTVQVARHKDRPYSLDYIKLICDDFFELHGDRSYGDDHAIVAGTATFEGQTVMLICQQKGRDMKEKQYRNLGMSHPEGYRKAQRLMRQAEKFKFPLITFIDTPGASIALPDEERGQSEAIAASIYLMFRLRIPIVTAVIGEGCSGGALAISIADRILMMEHSYYTVAAPEAAADILKFGSPYAYLVAEGQRIKAKDAHAFCIADEVIPEPLGGAHRDYTQAAEALKAGLRTHLRELKQIPIEDLLEKRYQKFRTIGHFGRETVAKTAQI
ncbi:MAG: acetyl-CoA carboxylase carboxyltransferase subunit alpha [Chloroflexi bacterium]|nr:MAG: acetyl-CoA carboxylase carboxyltransferase subunit alpha [Chloroflexota bacterium]